MENHDIPRLQQMLFNKTELKNVTNKARQEAH